MQNFSTFNQSFSSNVIQIKTTKEYKVGQKISIDSGSSLSAVINQVIFTFFSSLGKINFYADCVWDVSKNDTIKIISLL